jgi:hypothetical protein
MEWIAGLTDDERKITLAAISHNTIDYDFDLSEAEWAIAETICNDLDRAADGFPVAGFAGKVPAHDRHMLWAMMIAYVRDIHAPVQNLPESAWTRADEIHDVVNMWEVPKPAHAAPMP